MLAEKLVKAPNYGKSVEQLGKLSQNELKKWQMDQQYRVAVNSSCASLHIGIIEPKQEWAINPGTLWYEALKKPFKNMANQQPETKMPEILYWQKFPEDGNDGKTAFSFSKNPQKDHVLWEKPKGSIICLHGLQMNKNILASTWGQILAVHGYRVILVDLRGHGRSTGDYLTYGRVESRDISQIIDDMEDKDLLNGRLIIMGGSYGAAVAVQTAAIDNRVDAVIAMEPFTSLKEVAPDFARQRLGLLAMLIGKKEIYKIVDKAGSIAKFDPDTDTPLKAVQQIEIPILFIHGKDDKHIPFRHSQDLNAAACCGKLVIIDGKNHMNLAFEDTYPLRDEIINWLEDDREPTGGKGDLD